MKRKSLLLSAISALMVSVLMLTAASFAWFEFSLTPEIDSFQLDIVTGDSLQIGFSADGAFSNKVYKDDIVRVSAGKFPNNDGANDYKLNAATPDYDGGTGAELKLTDNALTFYTFVDGQTYQDYKDKTDVMYAAGTPPTGLLKNATAGNDYIEITLYLRANKAMAVSLETTDLFKAHDSNVNFTDILNSLRLVAVYSKVPNPKSAPAVLGTSAYVLYNPDTNLTAPLATNQMQNVVDLDDRTGLPVVPEKKFADTHFNKYTANTPVSNKIKLFDAVDPTTTDDVDIFDVWQVRIYIWVEGFDGDSNMESAGASFWTHLKFVGEVS